MTEAPPARSFPLVSLLLASFPLLLLIIFFAYVVRAWLVLGHWPSYNNPDPKQLGWWIQHSFLQLGFITFPAVAVLATLFAIGGRLQSRDFPFWTMLAITAMGCGIVIAFARVDPGGFVSWFWD